jgi:hypothetical protein
VDLDGNAVRGRPRRTLMYQIGQVLAKGQVKNTEILQACMNLMKVEVAKVCVDRRR